jgi:phosphate-selective porin OprO/OprP
VITSLAALAQVADPVLLPTSPLTPLMSEGIAYDAPPIALIPPAPISKPSSWSATWHGWDGLRLELNRKTLLGHWVPSVTNLTTLGHPSGVNLLHPDQPSPSPWAIVPDLHLNETRLSARLGGKVAVDAAAFRTTGNLEGFDGGVQLRRARIFARGDCLLVLPVSYEIEMGYIPNEFFIENSFIEFRNLGMLGSLKGGQFQAPMTLVNSGSSRDMMFMEAAPPIQALAAGVEAGLQLGRSIARQRMTWALGFFANGVGNDFGDATEDFGRAVTRITGLAIDRVDPKDPRSGTLLHLGLSGYFLYADSGSLRYRSRPASHLAPFVVDTGTIQADTSALIGTEAAWVHGPWTVQAEALRARGETLEGDGTDFQGLYVAGSYFLTGESRPYNRTQGCFARVTPTRNFQPGRGGWGAWELAGRWSHVDLNSSGIAGGRLSMGAVALNWYLHSHVKWRFEFDFGQVSGRNPSGNLQIFQSRLELDF